MSPRNCLYILLFWIHTTHANIFEELLIAVKSIEDKVNILNERVENENKKIVSELNLMKENIEKIDSKLNDARGNDYMINLKSNMGYLSRGKWIKIFSHNTRGGLFASDVDALKKNPENPSADLYSILYQLESFRTPEGFHFKICYPELNGCNLWIQTSNPAQEWNIEGFQAVHLSFQDNGNNTNWTGLGKNKYGGKTIIDDQPNNSIWWTAIGAKQFYPNNKGSRTIPGPLTNHVKKVELWCFVYEFS